MKGVAEYAVVYDISSDRERIRVDKTLKNFGFRIQKSVFECRMDRKGRDQLLAQLEKLGIKTGFIKIYRLDYSARNPVIGAKPKNRDDGNAFIL